VAKAKVEKVLLYTETTPLKDHPRGPQYGKSSDAAQPANLRDKLLTALIPRLTPGFVVQKIGATELEVRRTADAAHVVVRALEIGRHYSYTPDKMVITVGPTGWRSKETRRYPADLVIDRSSVPEHWVFSYSVNLAGIAVALLDALDRAEQRVAYESEMARDRRTVTKAVTARIDKLAALLGVSTRRDNAGLAPVGLDAKVVSGALFFDVIVRVKNMTGRNVVPYLALFPDAELSSTYSGIKMGGISEQELDYVLNEPLFARQVRATKLLSGTFDASSSS
jgi:hypothetical protein